MRADATKNRIGFFYLQFSSSPDAWVRVYARTRAAGMKATMRQVNLFDSNIFCPHCQSSAAFWKFGFVFHSDLIHIKIRNQPDAGGKVYVLASLVRRAVAAK